MGATTSVQTISVESRGEEEAVRARPRPRRIRPAPPPPKTIPFYLFSRASLASLTANPRPCLPSQSELGYHPFQVMRQSNGRAFLVDATGATEITSVSSEFLRALLGAGTAPPRNTGAAASGPDRAILPASPPDGSRDGTPPDPSPARRPRRTYFPRMTRNEALVFKVYDSETDGRARFTAQSAFGDPTTPAGAPARESIEVRTIAFF